jgi:DNA replication initiation complex subunit (GINS family)
MARAKFFEYDPVRERVVLDKTQINALIEYTRTFINKSFPKALNGKKSAEEVIKATSGIALFLVNIATVDIGGSEYPDSDNRLSSEENELFDELKKQMMEDCIPQILDPIIKAQSEGATIKSTTNKPKPTPTHVVNSADSMPPSLLWNCADSALEVIEAQKELFKKLLEKEIHAKDGDFFNRDFDDLDEDCPIHENFFGKFSFKEDFIKGLAEKWLEAGLISVESSAENPSLEVNVPDLTNELAQLCIDLAKEIKEEMSELNDTITTSSAEQEQPLATTASNEAHMTGSSENNEQDTASSAVTAEALPPSTEAPKLTTEEQDEELQGKDDSSALPRTESLSDPKNGQDNRQSLDKGQSSTAALPSGGQHTLIEQDAETGCTSEHKENKKGRKALYWMLGAGVLEAAAVVLPYQMGLTSSILGASASFSLPLLYAGLVLLPLSIGVIVWKIETSGTEQVAEDTITNQGTEADISIA